MNIDLQAIFAGQVSYSDTRSALNYAMLYGITDDFFNTLASILDPAADAAVLFVPHDSATSDQGGQGWTVSHIIAHLSATLEEAAALSAMLARGVKVEGRLRYETPWQELSTMQLVKARLQESRRMCRAFLDSWPDTPHLDTTITIIPPLGPLDAIGCYMLGIAHGQGHLDQTREALRQHDASL